MSSTHALKNQWFVSFLPHIAPDMVATEYKGDWNRASKDHMERLDWVTTVEEVWSTLNSMPKLKQLGPGSTFIFARSDVDPSFESFPNGSRVVVSLQREPATKDGLDAVVSAVLGENMSVEVGVPVCDVLRIAYRPNQKFSDLVRVEVWLNDASYSASSVQYLKELFKSRSLKDVEVTEIPFDTPIAKRHAPGVCTSAPAPSAESAAKASPKS